MTREQNSKVREVAEGCIIEDARCQTELLGLNRVGSKESFPVGGDILRAVIKKTDLTIIYRRKWKSGYWRQEDQLGKSL